MGTRPNTETLIFLHIPKTAGTTLSHIIVRQYVKNEIFNIRNPSIKGPIYSRHYGPTQKLITLSESERTRFRCIMGHFNFGIHELISGSFSYMTMLRNPVQRVLSQFGQYNHMARRNELGDRKPLSLEDFLHDKTNALNNHQTRFLRGYKLKNRPCQQDLDRAKLNLRRYFSVVGTTEQFDESMIIMAKAFGWRKINYVPRNIGTERPDLDDIKSHLKELIVRHNQLDMELHRYARELLGQKIAEYGPNFERDLKRFRESQKRHGLVLIERIFNVIGRIMARWYSLSNVSR